MRILIIDMQYDMSPVEVSYNGMNMMYPGEERIRMNLELSDREAGNDLKQWIDNYNGSDYGTKMLHCEYEDGSDEIRKEDEIEEIEVSLPDIIL